jgi:hypothetical protein
MSKKTIFISSTYEDLKEHRSQIWELLENYDVHVNGMEKFGARKETPLETCLNEVERSDIYVGVISFRFGSIEPKTGKSYTQLEYEKALELDKELLIYLVDEKNAKTQAEFIDFGEKHKKLQNFKKLLSEKHTVDFFKSPPDLSGKLKNRLDELLVAKEEESFTDKEGSILLEKFYLFPNKYSGRELPIKAKISGKAYPASKSLCNGFGLEFGESLVLPIEIIEPENGHQISELIIIEKDADFYFENKDKDEIKFFGRLLFSDERVTKLKAQFFDEEKINFVRNPDYDPNYVNPFDVSKVVFGKRNPEYFKERELIKGEGKALLSFRKTIDRKKKKDG